MRCLLILLLCLQLFSPFGLAAGGEKDGWVLFRQRDYVSALKRFEVDVNKYREWAELRDAMGWCHYYLEQYDEAEARFREALELKPDYKWSLEGLAAIEAARRAPLEQADALLAAGQYQEARAAYQRIQRGETPAEDGAFVRALRGEGWCLYYLARYREAVKSFRGARKKNGDDADTLRGLAYCEYAQGDYRHALTSLQLSFKLEPDHYLARLTAGWAHYHSKDYDKARAEFERAERLSSGAWGAWLGIGWCRWSQSDGAGALEAFREALELSPYALGAELSALIEAQPSWRPLHLVTGWSALRANLSSWALGSFQTAEALACEVDEARAGQAFALFRMGRYDEALERVSSATKAQAEMARSFPVVLADGRTARVEMNLYSLEAWIAQRKGRYDEAVTLFRQLRRREGGWPDPACGEGWALYAQGDFPGAERAFAAALELLPGYSDAIAGAEAIHAWRYADYDAGWASLYAGDLDGARRSFEAIKNDSRNPFPRANRDLVEASLGWVALRAGDDEGARAAFERALEMHLGQGLAEKGLGFLSISQERWSEAGRRLRSALDDSYFAKDAETWAALGRALLKDKRLPEAGEAFARAVEFGPSLAAAHAGQGMYYKRTGKNVEARIALERAITLDPSVGLDPELAALMNDNEDFFRLHSPLAWAWFYRGAYGPAEEQFRLALEKDPLETSAARGLGLSLLRTGQLAEAKSILLEWIERRKKHEADWGLCSQTLFELGWAQYGAGDYSAALKAFKLLEDLHEGMRLQYAEPHDGIGWCYLRMGKRREARKAFLEAVSISPRHESSLDGLEALAELER